MIMDIKEQEKVAPDAQTTAAQAIEEAISTKYPDLADADTATAPTKTALPDDVTETDDKADQRPDSSSDSQDDSQESPAEEPAKEPELSSKQIQAAKHLGYTDDEIADMTPTEARKAERVSRRLRQKESQVGRMEQELKDQQKAISSTPEYSEPEDDEDQDFDFDDDDDAGTSGSDRHDSSELSASDDVQTMVRKINQMGKTITDLRDQLDSSSKRDATIEADQFFDGLDQSIFDQFGKGKISSFDADSYEAESRRQVLSRAEKLQAMASDDGDTISLAEALDTALSMVAKDQYKQSMASTKSAKAKNLRKRAPARASSDRTKTAPDVPLKDRQVSNIEKAIRAKGLPVA